MHLTSLARQYCPETRLTSDLIRWAKIKWIGRCDLTDQEVTEGEHNEEIRERIIQKCKKRWNKIYRMFEKDAIKNAKSHIGQELLVGSQLYSDIIFCNFAYGFTADEYFAFELENKSANERHKYASDRYRRKMAFMLNDFFAIGVFLDKFQTYQELKDVFLRDAISVKSDKDKESFLEFIRNHPNFIKKRVDLARGESVELVSVQNRMQSPEQLFQYIRKNGHCILEEQIEQAPALAIFHPSSVNTIRCISFRVGNKLEIPYCILRTGRGSSVIDNASAGGISAAIDAKTGVVFTNGMDEKNNVYAIHPDGQIPFKGYQIPDWASFLELIQDVATRREGVNCIGWDVAYSTKGWCIVEGNFAPQIEARQVLCGGMKAEFDALINKIHNLGEID